jgi:hypothetical protein
MFVIKTRYGSYLASVIIVKNHFCSVVTTILLLLTYFLLTENNNNNIQSLLSVWKWGPSFCCLFWSAGGGHAAT